MTEHIEGKEGGQDEGAKAEGKRKTWRERKMRRQQTHAKGGEKFWGGG